MQAARIRLSKGGMTGETIDSCASFCVCQSKRAATLVEPAHWTNRNVVICLELECFVSMESEAKGATKKTKINFRRQNRHSNALGCGGSGQRTRHSQRQSTTKLQKQASKFRPSCPLFARFENCRLRRPVCALP